MNVVYAASAQEDLDAIDVLISRGAPDRAITFVRELQAIADDLANGPARFPLVDARRFPNVHRRNHKGFRIPYRTATDHVEILPVHHDRRATPDV